MSKQAVEEPDLKIIEETDDNFQPTGVEAEDKQEAASPKPYDPEQIRVDPKTFSLRQILDMIDDGDLELAPDFQRLKVWTPVQKSRLIESVLLRIPLPAFYFSSDEAGALQVVDGLQRLSTIHDYVRGGKEKKGFFPLDGLEYLQDQVGGKGFKQLNSPMWTRRIYNTQIMANVIDPQTPYRVKFDIFRRINTGGSPLNAQEIRHCLSQPQSRDLLKRMAFNKEFVRATHNAVTGSVRMVDREVILRFCAFNKFPGLQAYAESASMDEFLNRSTQILDEISAPQMEQLEAEFTNSMANAFMIFGRHAFRKWPKYYSRISPFNRALFDVWSVLLAPYTQTQLSPVADQIISRARELMTSDSAFTASISAGTSDVQKVATRFRSVRELLNAVV